MTIVRYALLCLLGTSLSLAGCARTEEVPAIEQPPAMMQGTVNIDNGDTNTRVTYTFHNHSKETITVIGGAMYTLQKDHTVVEKGAVPIKDYLDLEPGQAYKDTKTFTNLPKGDYLIEVEWTKTKVSTAFSRN